MDQERLFEVSSVVYPVVDDCESGIAVLRCLTAGAVASTLRDRDFQAVRRQHIKRFEALDWNMPLPDVERVEAGFIAFSIDNGEGWRYVAAAPS